MIFIQRLIQSNRVPLIINGFHLEQMEEDTEEKSFTW